MIVQNDEPPTSNTAADADLILRSRSGDGAAFGELWRRHYPSGVAVARSITSSIDPDDLVQEAYTRIYQAILKGGGPNGSFRAYLFTSIRNTAAAWGRARRETAVDELETVADPDSTDQAANDALDRGLTAQAFRSLPTRWQEVLWYTEIEQMKPAEVAPLLGMKAGAVSQLAFRAREGLREAWIQAHLRSTASDSECHWTIEHLGAHSRGNLSARDRKRVDAHLEDCARCLIVAGEAKDVSNRLALVLLPLVLGVTGATGYAALLQGGGAPVVAVAAMPSSVVSGGVVVGGGAGLPIGLDGASGTVGPGAGGGAGSAGGGASGGAVTGIGALVGAGSAALVVAGVVAAATIVPGLLDASPVTSLPNAGDADGSSISSEVVPDGDIESDEKMLLKVPDDAPKKDADTAPEPEVPEPAPPVAEDTPSAPPVSERPGDGEGNDGVEPSEPPVDPTEPTDPPEGENPDPGEGENPDPDPGEGENPDPDPEPDPEPDPGEPTDPVGIVSSNLCLNEAFETVVSVDLHGFANATVQPLIAGSTNGTRSATLDANGNGTATLKPTALQIVFSSQVEFDYVDFGADLTASTTLKELGVTLGEVASAPRCDTTTETTPATELESADAETPATGLEPEPRFVEVPTVQQIEPTPEAHVVEEPIVEEPIVEEPIVEERAAEEPEVDTTPEEAVVEEPAATAPAEDTVPAE